MFDPPPSLPEKNPSYAHVRRPHSATTTTTTAAFLVGSTTRVYGEGGGWVGRSRRGFPMGL